MIIPFRIAQNAAFFLLSVMLILVFGCSDDALHDAFRDAVDAGIDFGNGDRQDHEEPSNFDDINIDTGTDIFEDKSNSIPQSNPSMQGDKSYDTDLPDTDTEVGETAQESSDYCDIQNPVELYLTAEDSNAMAGPVLARSIINAGGRVNKAIKTYEFLNYYNFPYEASQGNAISIRADLRATDIDEEILDLPTTDAPASTDIDIPLEEPQYAIQIGISSREQLTSTRRLLNLTLSIDNSDSMNGHPLDMAKVSCSAIAGSLKSGDIISLVTWGTENNVVLDSHTVNGPMDTSLLSACNTIAATGGTDLHEGLVKAYEITRNNFDATRMNRVVLMSDGGTNVGITVKDLISNEADDTDGEGIYLIGAGMAATGSSYEELLVDTLADAGKGSYLYIDTAEEAQKMFGDRFISNLEIAVRNVEAELILPPSFEMVVEPEEASPSPPTVVEPQHLAPNDTMIFHYQIKSCDPAAYSLESQIMVKVHYEDPFTREQQYDTFETNVGVLLSETSPLLLKGEAIVAYADALIKLRVLSGTDAHKLIDETLLKVEEAAKTLANDPDLNEIKTLLTKYKRAF